MTEMSCAQVHEASAEYALEILPPDERGRVAAHLLRCPHCREEVQELSQLGARLLDLVPGVEPPIGFDSEVLARVRRRRRPNRIHVLLSVAAAAAVIAVAAIGIASLGHKAHSPAPVELTAQLFQANHSVGTVYVDGRPTWISMTVHQATVSGAVTCQLIERQGQIITVGTFNLVDGSGSWGVPDPSGTANLTGARLVGPSGSVVATASFAGS
jgi:hypothetical protein